MAALFAVPESMEVLHSKLCKCLGVRIPVGFGIYPCQARYLRRLGVKPRKIVDKPLFVAHAKLHAVHVEQIKVILVVKYHVAWREIFVKHAFVAQFYHKRRKLVQQQVAVGAFLPKAHLAAANLQADEIAACEQAVAEYLNIGHRHGGAYAERHEPQGVVVAATSLAVAQVGINKGVEQPRHSEAFHYQVKAALARVAHHIACPVDFLAKVGSAARHIAYKWCELRILGVDHYVLFHQLLGFHLFFAKLLQKRNTSCRFHSQKHRV